MQVDPARQRESAQQHGGADRPEGIGQFAPHGSQPLHLVQPLDDTGILDEGDRSEGDDAQHQPGAAGNRWQQVDKQGQQAQRISDSSAITTQGIGLPR